MWEVLIPIYRTVHVWRNSHYWVFVLSLKYILFIYFRLSTSQYSDVLSQKDEKNGKIQSHSKNNIKLKHHVEVEPTKSYFADNYHTV